MDAKVSIRRIRCICEGFSSEHMERRRLTLQRWLYIVLSNAIWAIFPLWVLKRAYSDIGDAFRAAAGVRGERYVSGDKISQDEKRK